MADEHEEELKLTQVPVDVEVLVDARDIAKMSPLTVADIIMEVDDEVGRWEFTLLMYEYFRDQREALVREGSANVDATVEELQARLEV